MDRYRQMLLDPPFAADPPVKVYLPARTLGIVIAILSGIAVLFGVVAMFGLLGLGAMLAFAGPLLLLPVIGAIVSLIAAAISAFGGYKMWQGDRGGKVMVIYGLALSVLGSLIGSLGTGDLVGWIFGALIAFAVYYLVVLSRFETDPVPASGPAPTPSGTDGERRDPIAR